MTDIEAWAYVRNHNCVVRFTDTGSGCTLSRPLKRAGAIGWFRVEATNMGGSSLIVAVRKMQQDLIAYADGERVLSIYSDALECDVPSFLQPASEELS